MESGFHSLALKIAIKKQKVIRPRRSEAEETARSLLRHPDERVKLNAAFLCLNMNTHISDAINVLREIQEHSTDPTLRMTAKMLTIQETQEK